MHVRVFVIENSVSVKMQNIREYCKIQSYAILSYKKMFIEEELCNLLILYAVRNSYQLHYSFPVKLIETEAYCLNKRIS